MYCKFCGKEIWLSGVFRDRDFCIPNHRRKFHQRLRNVILQSEASELQAHTMAPSRFMAMPSDCDRAASPAVRVLETVEMPALPPVTLLAASAFLEPVAYQLECEPETDATPEEPGGAIPDFPPASAYESRLQRVMDLLAKMPVGRKKRKSLFAA